MNKRQKKKQFKKLHGYNPPSTKKIKARQKRMEQTEKNLLRIAKKRAKRINFLKQDLVHKIQKMSEKEFQIVLKNLTLEQQALAKRMRYRKE